MKNLFYIRTGIGSAVVVLFRVISFGIISRTLDEGTFIMFNFTLWKLTLNIEIGVKDEVTL